MARDDDDDTPWRAAKKLFEARALEALSIAELENYITDLKGEIARAEEMIAGKRRLRAGADSLFAKKKS